MRIDSHQHFWDLKKFAYKWMPPGESILKRTYLPEDLKPILAEHKFDGCVVVQANVVLPETYWLLELAAKNAFIKGVVGWVDLEHPALAKTLDELTRHKKFKGVRHPIHDEADDKWMLRPNVIRGLKELEQRDIPYDLLLRPQHLPYVPELASKLPKLRMVIDHLAKPKIASKTMDPWTNDIAACAKIASMHCKVSGMVTEADPKHWTASDLRPYVQHVLHSFGPKRLMFGSDWPVCRLVTGWKQVLAACTQALGALPPADYARVMGGTAVGFYRL